MCDPDLMLLNALIFGLIAAAPCIAALRRRPPAAHFAVAATAYAVGGAVHLAASSLPAAPTTTPTFRDTYYVVKYFHYLLSTAIVFALLGGAIWLQSRLGFLRFVRMTKTAFWLLHVGWLGGFAVTVFGAALFTMPRRYIEYPEYVAQITRIATWSSHLTQIALLALIALLLAGVIARVLSARR